jgi:hypothetical protein
MYVLPKAEVLTDPQHNRYAVIRLNFVWDFPWKVRPLYLPRPVGSESGSPIEYEAERPVAAVTVPPAWKVSLSPHGSISRDGELAIRF